MKADELNRRVQYDILTEISDVAEASNVDLRASYQAKEDKFPDLDCIVHRNPDTEIIDSPDSAIEYRVTYDNQDIEFVVYSQGDRLGVEIEGNGKSQEFLSDFRDALGESMELEGSCTLEKVSD